MAIRKISELPYVDCMSTNIESHLSSSKMEISYPVSDSSPYTFQSKHIRMDKLGDYINSKITGDLKSYSANNTTLLDMFRQYIFNSHIKAKNGFGLSGNLSVNSEGSFDDKSIVLKGGKIIVGCKNLDTTEDNGFELKEGDTNKFVLNK